jgi:hypothetical protein
VSERARAIYCCVALHQTRDVEPLQLRDGVDFVQKWKDRPDAELVDVRALRDAVLRCNALHSLRQCCSALQLVDAETARTPHADALFGPADRAI